HRREQQDRDRQDERDPEAALEVLDHHRMMIVVVAAAVGGVPHVAARGLLDGSFVAVLVAAVRPLVRRILELPLLQTPLLRSRHAVTVLMHVFVSIVLVCVSAGGFAALGMCVVARMLVFMAVHR